MKANRTTNKTGDDDTPVADVSGRLSYWQGKRDRPDYRHTDSERRAEYDEILPGGWQLSGVLGSSFPGVVWKLTIAHSFLRQFVSQCQKGPDNRLVQDHAVRLLKCAQEAQIFLPQSGQVKSQP
jgi:hypothetical protein